MSEDEQRTTANEEAGDEVEAHSRRTAANEEAGDEAAEDNDVEGHMRHGSPGDEGARVS
jgi:hypothetical protein